MSTLNPQTCTISSATYLIHPQVLGSIEQTVRLGVVIPVTLLSEDDVLSPDLDALLQGLVARDDVLSADFLRILVTKPEKSGVLADKVRVRGIGSEGGGGGGGGGGGSGGVYTLAGIKKDGNDDDNDNDNDNDDNDGNIPDLPSGPYFIVGGNLHQAWRLHSDPLGAFVYGTFPASVTVPPADAVFVPTTLGIPVPSRLFYPLRYSPSSSSSSSPPSSSRASSSSSSPSSNNTLPLAGMRISLKDVVDVAGTPTTLSSRAFAAIAAPAETSAPFVRELLEKGAVLVGKSKTMNLEGGRDWVDVQQPFSPRADGYQVVEGGSTGTVAGVAGYEWLDGAVGSDTAGSISLPATCAGTWAIRPSWGSTNLEGVHPMCPRFDTLAPTARSASSLYTLTRNLLSSSSSSSSNPPMPTRLIFPLDIFPTTSPAHKLLTDALITCLETYLGVKHTPIDISALWTRTGPDEGREQGLQNWMARPPTCTMSRDYLHSYESFRRTYREKFDGREPFVEPMTRFLWDIGKEVSDGEYDEYVRRNGVLREWFEKNVMPDERTVVVVPVGNMEPMYRDDVPQRPSVGDTDWWGVGPAMVASLLEAPHVVAPFAQTPYQSRISGVQEHLPVCGGVIGFKGTDLMLIRMLEGAFGKAGWRTTVDVGRYAFPLGEGEGEDGKGVDDSVGKMRINLTFG